VNSKKIRDHVTLKFSFLPPPALTCQISQITMTFSDDYATVLFPFIKMYKDCKNEKGRHSVVTKAAEAVRSSRDEMEVESALPKEVETVCLPFFIFI
jgi:hypothetical protein